MTGTILQTRSELGLVAPDYKPRIPGPVYGSTVHYNGPAMQLLGKSHEECMDAWLGIQTFHMGPQREWADIAYTMGACHHGYLMAGRGAGVRTAANGTTSGNDHWYAIMCTIGGNEQPTPEMLRAVVDGAKMLNAPKLVPHSYHKSTQCCGDPLRSKIKNNTFEVAEPEPEPTVEEEEDDDMIPDGPRMKEVQEDLNWIKFNSKWIWPELEVTGKFDAATSKVLDAFRGVWGIRLRDERPNSQDITKIERTIHEIKEHNLHV